MPFIVRINRPGAAGWSQPMSITRHRKLEDARATLAVEVETSASPSLLYGLRLLVLRARAHHAKPGEHIQVEEYDHWIDEEEGT